MEKMCRPSAASVVSGAKLEQIEFENEEVKYQGEVLIQKEKEDVELEDRIRHGQGVLSDLLDGTRYEGQFSLNRKHGKGKLVYEATGDAYEGQFKDNEIHGKGVFSFSNGEKFDGEFEHSQMRTGVFTFENGDEYAGDFKEDLFDGYSLMKYANGDTYCGDFQNGKRHGNGILRVKASGREFVGEFENGKMVHGQMKAAEGEYLGQFGQGEDGKYFYHGKGLMKFATGDVYEGRWENGQMHGYGVYVYHEDFEDSDSEGEDKDKKSD